MSDANRNDCPYHVGLHPDEQCTCPPDRARIYALPPLSQDEVVAAIRLATVIARDAELLRLCGPVCPHDGKRASEHRQPYVSTPRSFAPLPEKVKHRYEECVDCDDLISYHHEGIEHCHYCAESPRGCDGTPETQPSRPPHAPWPEGEEWLRSHA